VASILPWTRFGQGSGLFGGWGTPLRWSVLASVVATIGAGVALAVWIRGGRPGRRAIVVLAIMAGLAGLGALLHFLRPPPFSRPWIGPWVALAGTVLALIGGALALRDRATADSSAP
jgi:hypothetical protein